MKEEKELKEIEFVAGDVVKLKGSHVIMTVEAVLDNKVKCVWFDVNNHLHRDEFKKITLLHILS
jgi:uncharacterized protein YodC (DUF2158 family)